MNTIRNGKIARLPKEIREELNQRLANHESSTPLVKWLNGLPAVRAVMAEEFGGKAVYRQNLHEWRHGGHAEWLREHGALEMMGRIFADGQELTEAAQGAPVDKVAAWLAARYLAAARKFTDDAAGNETAWNRLRECCNDLTALQRGEHLAQRLEFERERFAGQNKILKTLENAAEERPGERRDTENPDLLTQMAPIFAHLEAEIQPGDFKI